MSKFIVLDPHLSYFAFSQTVTSKQIKKAKEDLGPLFDFIKFVPYTPELKQKLKSQYKDYYSIPNYTPQI